MTNSWRLPIPATHHLSLSAETLSFVGHALSWRSFDLIRRRWLGRFVLKGVLAPEDARIAREHGVDAIWISNMGVVSSMERSRRWQFYQPSRALPVTCRC